MVSSRCEYDLLLTLILVKKTTGPIMSWSVDADPFMVLHANL